MSDETRWLERNQVEGHQGIGHVSEDLNSESSPVTQCSRGSSPSLKPIEFKCLAEPCLKSWTTESWEIVNHFCFELPNFQLICYMARDNWNDTIFQLLRAPFSDSFNHREYNREWINKVIYNSHCFPQGCGSPHSGPIVSMFMHNVIVFIHLIAESKTI